MSKVELCHIYMLRNILESFEHLPTLVKVTESKIFQISDNGQNIIFAYRGKNEVMYCTTIFIASIRLHLSLPVAIMNPTAISLSANLFIPTYSQQKNLFSNATANNWPGFNSGVIPVPACLGRSSRVFSGAKLALPLKMHVCHLATAIALIKSYQT